MAKIISFKSACRLSDSLRKQGKTVIWTSGFFDILHVGHIEFFQLIRKWNRRGILMVGVETDEYLSASKGVNRPIFNQNFRCQALAGVVGIDFVVILEDKHPSEDDFIRIYKNINPSIIIFGNTESRTLKLIKMICRKLKIRFKHLPHIQKLAATSKIADIILRRFSY